MNAPLPENEAERLKALDLYRILDTLPEKVFDEITHLAAHICGCPIATISIIDENRQWYKSRVGIQLAETPRDISFCAHTIGQDSPLIVEDATQDKRFSDNPVVTKDPNVRFYAGVPLTNKDGFALGALCVVDLKPRHLSPEQTLALEALSRHIVTHLELRRALIERSLAEAEVQRLNQLLEKRVEERTGQLNAAYESLKAEVAERERIQRQMVQIQKMEAVGRLAGGIAHDFNNILLVISGYSELLLTGKNMDAGHLDFLGEIQKAGVRGASLTRQLLTFSRRQVIEPKVFNLNDTVDSMIGMLVRLIGEDIKFEVKKSGNVENIRADVSQVEQVIMNLVINARDAMPNGGQLLLETSSLVLKAPLIYDGGEIEPNRYTLLTIRDSGTGMTPDVKARMFEPFFTTKPEGKGTGLGLATSFGIIQQCGGFITCDSLPGRGTTFQVFLPRPEANALLSKTGRLSSASPRGKETILLVEDDAAVRKLAARMLQDLGYHVLEAEDGLEALALVQSRSLLLIDLLVTDVVMPNMNGRELSERLVRLRPEIKCLLMSGHTDDVLIHRGVLDQQTLFLQKPFTPQQLAKRVREVLDQTAL
jgi:signal transduction histidine kinase/CheY-like chemotaxis protein